MKTTVDGKRQNPTAAARKFAKAAKRKRPARKRSRGTTTVHEYRGSEAKMASDLGAGAKSGVLGDNKLGGREEAIPARDPLLPTAYERRAHAALLGQAAARIAEVENQLIPLRQMQRMIELVETLMGRNGAGVSRAGGGEESLIQKLVAASKHQSELGETMAFRERAS